MPDLILLPPDMGFDTALLLTAVSMFGSFLTAAAGIGGGIVLLAVMATVMPAHAVIPVHGLAQLGSNLGRAVLLRQFIDRSVIVPFAVGAAIGVALGGSVAVSLPTQFLRLALGLFILYSVWGPKPPGSGQGKRELVVTGVLASVLTMFIGATGTFISAMLRQRSYAPKELVATHALLMGIQHVLKVLTFGILGFSFSGWWGLIVVMIVAGFIGTWLGRMWLNRIPAKAFGVILKLLLSALALNLIVTALLHWL